MSTPSTTSTPARNREFAVNGINHLALVCADMERTIAFYTDVLGMPLVKNVALPDGNGHHFFFGLGNGDTLAFFHFPGAPAPAPGIAAPSGLPGTGGLLSAVGSMNHVAFNVPEDEIEEYRERLVAKGVEVSPIMNHDDSPAQIADQMHDGVYVRSIYFQDPDGILLEFASWTNAGKAVARDQRSDVLPTS
jgi:catechol 2,3-dioxygenase-like lactoylglutathione lyase family enzyme